MLETMAAFARRIDRTQAYVSQLKAEGRLVMRDGLVDVEASLARIEATRDPSRQHVAERHEAERQARRQQQQQATAEDVAGIDAERVGLGYKLFRARKMRADAEIAEMERDRLAGRLVLRETVDFVVADVAATVRARLEALPDRLAPMIYPLQTLEETRAVLVEAVEEVLQALAQQIERRGRELEGGDESSG